MGEDGSEERADSTDITRQDVLRASSRKEVSERMTSMGSSQRRPFLSGIVTSVLGVMGLSGVASASPDSQAVMKTLEEPDPQTVAKTLEERREFIEVLVANDIMSDQILREMDEASAQSVAGSASIAAGKDEDAGSIHLTFPKEPDEFRLAFGDELTDVGMSLPDNVDGKAITEEMNREVTGLTTTQVPCCDTNGYCNLPESATGRCWYHAPLIGRCGSYTCGTIICGPEGKSLGWCCACCGGGHPWCGGVPVCRSDRNAGVWC